MHNYSFLIVNHFLFVDLRSLVSGVVMKLFFQVCQCFLFLFFSFQSLALDIDENLKVNFVTEANYYPFEYLDDAKNIQGFDIDIAKAVCEVANLTCRFNSQDFDSLLLTLQFGRFDAVIAALDITDARKEMVDFSHPYYQSAPVFLSAMNDDKGFSIVDKSIGVQSGSSNHDYLIENAKKNSFIIAYQSSSQAFLDLKSGTIDAVFADKAVADDFLLKEDNQANFLIVQTENIFLDNFSLGYGIAVKKGNVSLIQRLNYGLEKIVQNGVYQKIFSQYFN